MERLQVASDTLGFYLGKLLWPWPLIPDYARSIDIVLNDQLYLETLPIILASALILLWLCRILGSNFAIGLAIFALFLLPTSGLVSFLAQAQSTVSNHYLYLSLFGVGWAVAVSVERFSLVRWAFVPILFAWVGLNTYVSGKYETNRSLFGFVIEQNPKSYLSYSNMGVVEYESGHIDQAIENLKMAMKLVPRLSIAPSNLAQLYWIKGQRWNILGEIEPLAKNPEFLRYNEFESSLPVIFQFLGRTYASQGQWNQALVYYCQALKNPRRPPMDDELNKFYLEYTRQMQTKPICPSS